LLILDITAELLLSNKEFNFVLILSKEAFVSVAKSVFTIKDKLSAEETCANLRRRVFKIAAIAGNK